MREQLNLNTTISVVNLFYQYYSDLMAQKLPQQRDSCWWILLTVSWIPPWEGQKRERHNAAAQ